MVSGLVAYGSGAQEMGEKGRRKAFTSITAPQKCKGGMQGNARQTHAERTITRKGTHACIRKRKKYPRGGNYSFGLSTRGNVSSAPALLCAFYKKIMRDLGGQRIDFCGHRAYNSIMAKGKKPDRQEGEE